MYKSLNVSRGCWWSASTATVQRERKCNAITAWCSAQEQTIQQNDDSRTMKNRRTMNNRTMIMDQELTRCSSIRKCWSMWRWWSLFQMAASIEDNHRWYVVMFHSVMIFSVIIPISKHECHHCRCSSWTMIISISKVQSSKVTSATGTVMSLITLHNDDCICSMMLSECGMHSVTQTDCNKFWLSICMCPK